MVKAVSSSRSGLSSTVSLKSVKVCQNMSSIAEIDAEIERLQAARAALQASPAAAAPGGGAAAAAAAAAPDLSAVGMDRNSVTVRVPGTSANMGPGYDVVGMAVDIWNELKVERAESFSMVNVGEGADVLPTDESNLVVVGLRAAFKAAGKDVPALKYTCTNRIPFARGLGSSSAAIVSGIVAGLVLAGHSLQVWGREELLQIAGEIEGHPDNVAPAIYGGIQLGIHTGERWMSGRVRCPDHLQCVLFIPDHVSQTSEARALLKDEVSRADAVYNMGHFAFLVNCLNNNDMGLLRYGTQDVLHQPQRGDAQSKHLFPMIEAANAAGAHATYLSGAGPSVIAITSGQVGDVFTQNQTERKDRDIAAAMQKAAAASGVTGRVFITTPSAKGAQVVDVQPADSTQQVKVWR